MHGSASDAVISKTTVTVERLKVKGALALTVFAFHVGEEAWQLVADQQETARVLIQKLAQLFDRGVVHHNARAWRLIVISTSQAFENLTRRNKVAAYDGIDWAKRSLHCGRLHGAWAAYNRSPQV